MSRKRTIRKAVVLRVTEVVDGCEIRKIYLANCPQCRKNRALWIENKKIYRCGYCKHVFKPKKEPENVNFVLLTKVEVKDVA